MDPERGNCPPRSVFSHCRVINQQVSSVSGNCLCSRCGALGPWCVSGSGSCKSLVWIREWELQVLGVDLEVGVASPWCG